MSNMWIHCGDVPDEANEVGLYCVYRFGKACY